MLKIAVLGSQGRMGQALVKAVQEHVKTQLTALTVSPSAELAPVTVQGKTITPVRDLNQVISTFDVCIDFTTPKATLAHLDVCREHRKAMIIGTTGFTAAEKQSIQAASQDIPIVLAPNTSIGMNVCFALMKKAADIVGKTADIEILEAHHSEKKDAPSGTALQIGELIANSLNAPLDEVAVYDKRGVGARKPGTIGFSSIRARDIVGEHTALFALDGESLEITHKATDRQAFARGAVEAAVWLQSQPAALYSMQDVLGLT